MSQHTDAISEAASAPGVRAATHVPRTWKAYFAVRPEVYVCCVFHKRRAEMSPSLTTEMSPSLTTAIRHRCAHKNTFTHLHVPHAQILSSRSLLDQKDKSSNMTMSTTQVVALVALVFVVSLVGFIAHRSIYFQISEVHCNASAVAATIVLP